MRIELLLRGGFESRSTAMMPKQSRWHKAPPVKILCFSQSGSWIFPALGRGSFGGYWYVDIHTTVFPY
jgi:hypothetical protein